MTKIKSQLEVTSSKREYVRDKRSPIPKSVSTSKVMSSIKAKNTKPEMKLRKALWRNGLKGYRIHWSRLPGSPDIAFTKKKIAIFVHGCFWHRCPFCKPSIPKNNSEFWSNKFKNNVERDQLKIKELNDSGWRTLIVWECQIKSEEQDCVNKISELVSI